MDSLVKDFKVRVGEFEGPLELLLDLIEKRKLHISDVSLSQVADEFIEYTKSIEDFPIADSADFILIASTLLLIKSKSLLPNLELTVEETENIGELEKRLALYKEYKKASQTLQKQWGEFLYFAEDKKGFTPVFSPTPEITLSSLKEALQAVIQNIPKAIEALPKVVVDKIISLEEMIEKLSERVTNSLRTSFSDFAKDKPDKKDFSNIGKAEKVNVIVSFLAMLELVKQGLLRVSQESHFDDIHMESENIKVPQY